MNAPPRVRFTHLSRDSSFITRSTFAASAVYAIMITRSTAKVVIAKIAYCASCGRAVSMNCGRIAAKKMMPFGLVALTQKPRMKTPRAVVSWSSRSSSNPFAGAFQVTMPR